jgi:hypothetical protein
LQAVINLVEPKKQVRQNRQTAFDTINQQAFFKQASLPDFILTIQQSSSTFMRVIRLHQRCNLESRRSAAYTSFPSNLQIGEADGDAPVLYTFPVGNPELRASKTTRCGLARRLCGLPHSAPGVLQRIPSGAYK